MKKSILEAVTSLPLFSKLSSAYLRRESAIRLRLTKGGKDSACRRYPGLVTCFGWEGDKNAPIAYIDGSFSLRSRDNALVGFGFNSVDSKIKWYNAEGYLPCLVSEYTSGSFEVKIESFADLVTVDGSDFVVAYSRITAENISKETQKLPPLPKIVSVLQGGERSLAPGQVSVRTCCVAADRFGKGVPFPTDSQLVCAGSFDEHFSHMRDYWNGRLSELVQLDIPDEKLMNAYRAGYIYTMIVKDGFELHVGENGYDRVFDHDVIGIISALLDCGDTKYFDEYQKTVLMNIQYPDARWKYAWIFAKYLFKTGDRELVKRCFDDIKKYAHSIEPDREDGGTGIMQTTCAIDSNGHWLIDNQSALTGLASYAYICSVLGESDEEKYANENYLSLLNATNSRLEATQRKFGLDYLPISMDEPNETGARSDPRDANWASMFLFGRWSWECYLFGAEQEGVMLDMIDRTYDHGFERRAKIDPTRCNFGGYPHGWFCSAYNAGYGSAALRGEKHRSLGIRAYRYMIDNAMSGPFSWWEGVGDPDSASPWDISHAASGGGSCPHMWGQATATKVLLDSILSVKYDGTVIIGRGIPEEWLTPDNRISVENYLAFDGRRIGYSLVVNSCGFEITLDKSHALFNTIIDLPYLIGKSFTCEGGIISHGRIVSDENVRHITVRFE